MKSFFLHKIVAGESDDSYGIYVAKLAGVPQGIINRAKRILQELESESNLKARLTAKPINKNQLSLFTNTSDPVMEVVKEALKNLDLNQMTPLAALNKIQELKEMTQKGNS